MPRIALPVFVVCAIASLPATAQTLAVPFPAAQIAFFDGQRVAVESEAGQAALAELDAFQTEASVELADRNQALLNQQAQLDAQASVLSGSARLNLEQRQERGTLELQRLIEDAQKELLGLQQRLDGVFQAKLYPAISAVAADAGVQFVFDRARGPVAWADPAYDLTDRTIERLDAE
jgi:Skp family chaperone for outer membrane proteins